MATRLKLSELQSLDVLKGQDRLLCTDSETGQSRSLTFSTLKTSSRLSELGDYADNQNDLLHAGLASGTLYVKSLTIGVE